MRSLKRFLSLALSLVLAAGAVSTFAFAGKFTDVPASNETLTKAVDLLAGVGITTGTTETTFGTTEGVTRQQMATFIYRLMKAGKTTVGKEGDNSTTFTDLKDPFYYFMISWANDMGIIKGRNETTFDPYGSIVLQDAYVMITRALGYEKDGALAYPFDYISIAEKIGLDEGLSANVNYDTALTRGDVAILLYNAFYADMATGETGYEVEYDIVTLPNGDEDVIEKGMTPYTVYDTVAEKIFGIKRTVQRVVATPNYCLDENEKTDSSIDDTVMITVKCFDDEYAETDSGLFGDLEFDSLGLPGTADDYFLMDLSIYYKKDGNKAAEIISASSMGVYKDSLPGSKVRFENGNNIAYQDSVGNVKAINGKVTIDGQVSYLFDAPWSYSKPQDMADKDKDCITLLWLAGSDRDPEDEDYVMDYNFQSDKDVLGRGAEAYDFIPKVFTNKHTGGKWKLGEENRVKETMVEADPRGVGIYTTGGMAAYMQIAPTAYNFEADAWDSNGDGKIDYLWLKPYTIGQINEDEGEVFMDRHSGEEHLLDTISAVYEAGDVPTIYSYGAVKEGSVFKNGQLFVGYINGPANYIKCSTATEMNYTPNQVFNIQKDGTYFGFNNGAMPNRTRLSRNYVGFPNAVGARVDIFTGDLPQYVSSNYNNITFGKSYEIVFVDDAMFHVKHSTGVLDEGNNYAMILPNVSDKYAYTESIGIVTDGKLQKSGNMLKALIGSEVKDIAVKPQTSAKIEENNLVADGSYSLMPVTPKQRNDTYDFSEYVGKLLTYSINSDGEYVFKIAPLASYTDKTVLKSDDSEAYYAYQNAEDDPKNTAAFVKSSGNLYRFVVKNTNTPHSTISPSDYVTFTYNTKVVIKTLDSDDEPVYTVYSYSKKPNFDKRDDLKNIKYIVKNNPNSSSMEELIYLYAESVDGDTSIKTGSTLDYRFVKASKSVSDGEGGRIVYYDVFNPFKGTIEEEYEAINDDATVLMDGIYSLSNGYINDESLLGTINNYGEVATSDTTLSAEDLGLGVISDYDKESGYLEIEDEDMIFIVDDKTVITFLDLDEGTIEVKKSSILTSKSADYRCGGNKNMPLLAFVVSAEIEDEDEYEYAKAICVVRCNDLDE